MTPPNKTETDGGFDNPTFIPDSSLEDGKGNQLQPSKAQQADEERGIWQNPIEFLLACISMSVGLGNLWRFPYTAYNNGGGAFLIPYLIVLTVIGRPIYYLEMCLGQFSRYGPFEMWNMSPILKGVGLMMTLGATCVVSYYCSIMAQTIFFFFASFAKTLPWSECHPDWGIEYCYPNGSSVTGVSNASLYYTLEVTKAKGDIDNGIGAPEWRLTLCLLLAWIIVFLTLWKGVKSSGKVAYFTAIFPYIVIFTLLIRGATLEGAGKGIEYFFKPDFKKIWEIRVWYEAVGQCFFSLGTGFGPLVAMSSHNPFNHNIYRDVWVVTLMDTFTSLLAGTTVFAVLGNLAVQRNATIEEVVTGGPGLAFVAYPEAIANFPWAPQLFAVLFFLMLLTLGIGSAAPLAGSAIDVISDQFPKLIKWQVTLVACIVGFLSGLIYITPGGGFMLDLVDYFGASFIVFTAVTLEAAGVSYFYGLNKFWRDIQFMLGVKRGIIWDIEQYYWKICWAFIMPAGLIFIMIYDWSTRGKFGEGAFPDIAVVCGWLLASIGFSFLPVMAGLAIWKSKGIGLKEKFLNAMQPTDKWGPQDPIKRQEWQQFKLNNPNNGFISS